VKSEKEIRDQVRQIRERVKGLSGFWIGEASSAIYALEWALGKRGVPPAEDLGRAKGGREKIAASLLKLAEKTPPKVPTSRPRRAVEKGRAAGRRRS
jgi:hypothetical protein